MHPRLALALVPCPLAFLGCLPMLPFPPNAGLAYPLSHAQQSSREPRSLVLNRARGICHLHRHCKAADLSLGHAAPSSIIPRSSGLDEMQLANLSITSIATAPSTPFGRRVRPPSAISTVSISQEHPLWAIRATSQRPNQPHHHHTPFGKPRHLGTCALGAQRHWTVFVEGSDCP